MKTETADLLMKFIASLAHEQDDLSQKIAAAEYVFASESPQVYAKYQTVLNSQRQRVNHSERILKVEELRIKLSRD